MSQRGPSPIVDGLRRAGKSARLALRRVGGPAQRADDHVPQRMLLTVGDETLLFMHIPKTAGTALRSTLKLAYRADERAFVYDPSDLRGAVGRDAFDDLPEADRLKLRLVMGHFSYGIHGSLGRPFRYVAVLRDPVDRVVSLYYHYRYFRGARWRGPARDEQGLIRQRRMSLEDWVFGQQRLAVDNGMTRNIAGRPRVRFGECPDDLLDEAIDHIDRHFALLLVTEELSRSHELLETLTGRRLRPVPQRNVNTKRMRVEELDPRVTDRIRRLNRLDARLHALACERLAQLRTSHND